MTALSLLAALVVAGGPVEGRAASTVAEAWRLLPQKGNACGEELGFDYGVQGGMRNFYCRALTVFTWKSLVLLAPSPFLSGPHSREGLKLDAADDFGHYNPAFVRWAVTALVPAAIDAPLREQTQRTYELQVRPLARVYYQVWRIISADPKWLSAERTRYGAAMRSGQGGWADGTVDLYHDVLGTSAQNWGGNDPNNVRSATMWWLRRTIDETAPLWLEGLERLLKTYDAKWLAAQKEAKPRPPPRREK